VDSTYERAILCSFENFDRYDIPWYIKEPGYSFHQKYKGNASLKRLRCSSQDTNCINSQYLRLRQNLNYWSYIKYHLHILNELGFMGITCLCFYGTCWLTAIQFHTCCLFVNFWCIIGKRWGDTYFLIHIGHHWYFSAWCGGYALVIYWHDAWLKDF